MHRARRLVVWCLLAALPIYAFSAGIVAMLGTSHVHRQVASASASALGTMQDWQDFRRSNHTADGTPHQHSHSVFERHHHDPTDASVVSADGTVHGGALSGDGGSTPDGTAALVLALAARIDVAPPIAASSAWPKLAELPMHSRDGDRLERPPRAS